MKCFLAQIGQCLATAIFVITSVGTYGCGDSASVDPGPQLASLSVTGGPLQPPFSSETTGYTVVLPNTTPTATVSATKSDSNDVLSGAVNSPAGQVKAEATISLPNSSSREIVLTVTAPDGRAKVYTIALNRPPLGGDNTLSSLTVSPGSLTPEFGANTEAYAVEVGGHVGNVTISATKSDPNGMLSGAVAAQAGQATGHATIESPPPGSSKDVTITVTAPDGQARVYTVTVKRTALGGDSALSDLTVSAGSLTPSFSANTIIYTVNVPAEITGVTVSATKSDPNAVLSGSVSDPGTDHATGQASIPLNGPGTVTTISVVVTAPDQTSRTYTITVNQAAAPPQTPTAPPPPASAPDLIQEDDSGFAPGQDSDNITSVTHPRFYIPQPGSEETPHLYIDEQKVDALFNPETSTLMPTEPLSDGIYEITSTVTNNATGLESSPSDLLTVTINTGS